jgi:carbon-monoxide dehydrogenase medium subunit
MYHTNYTRASGTADAVDKMAAGGQLLAGGMTLIPTMKQRLASPDTLIDLADCGLSGIEDTGSAIKIGAMTRHVEVAESGIVQKAIPALAALADGIGDRQVRNRGTIGGSVIMIRRRAIHQPFWALAAPFIPTSVILPPPISSSECLKPRWMKGK